MKTAEQRLKETLGEQLFALAVLQTELERLQERVAELEKGSKPKEEEEESNVTELKKK